MSNLIKMSDTDTLSFERISGIFRNNGRDPGDTSGARMSFKDVMEIQNAGFLVPRVMTQIVQEGIEPFLIGTRLLRRIEYTPGMQTVYPSIPALRAEEVGAGSDLPIYNIDMGGAATFGTTISRHGLAVQVDPKFIHDSQYPWISLWLQLAGNALARHKEEYIFSMITALGTVVFDNATGPRTTGATSGVPIKGTTTGRNLNGTFNGSMTMDDIFDMYATVLLQGFIPDTILVHPMAWLMWIKDPVMREFAIQAGGGAFFGQFTGNAAAQSNAFYNFNGLGVGTGQVGTYTAGSLTGGQQASATGGGYNVQTSGPVLPAYLGLPFRILVSPFMNFNPGANTTDILMFNSANLGAMIVAEDPHVNDWTDNRYNLTRMQIEEQYGFGILNDGQAIAVARNVSISSNEFALPARAIYDIGNTSSTFQQKNASGFTDFGTTPTVVL